MVSEELNELIASIGAHGYEQGMFDILEIFEQGFSDMTIESGIDTIKVKDVLDLVNRITVIVHNGLR